MSYYGVMMRNKEIKLCFPFIFNLYIIENRYINTLSDD